MSRRKPPTSDAATATEWLVLAAIAFVFFLALCGVEVLLT